MDDEPYSTTTPFTRLCGKPNSTKNSILNTTTKPQTSLPFLCVLPMFIPFQINYTLLLNILTPSILVAFGVLLLLLVCTALIAASEVAFMGMSPTEVSEIRREGGTLSQQVQRIQEKPHYLLATLLVGINFVNIAIVLVFNHILEDVFHAMPPVSSTTQYIIEVLIEIFVLVLFGEIMPKVYASSNKWAVVRLMANPILLLRTLCHPINWVLVKSTDLIEHYLINGDSGGTISQEDIDTAIDLTVKESDHAKQDKDLLKSIVKFGNVSTRQIMRTRVDVITVDISDSFAQVLNTARHYGYSRLPVLGDNEDEVKGVVFAKDLLAHLHQKDNPEYNWQDELIREAFFVPETKKIDKLLREFQRTRKHLAVVVDEYGGVKGIVTLEDILEEIVGEIEDEFDDQSDRLYQKIDANTFICQAKMMLNDVCRALQIDTTTFDAIRGDADSLAGLILNIAKRIPQKGEFFEIDDFRFEVEAADLRRILSVKIIRK
jgi:putative hemolysin